MMDDRKTSPEEPVMELVTTARRFLILAGTSFFLLLPALAQNETETQPVPPPVDEIGGDQLILDGEVIGVRVPPEPGDICMLCNNPLEDQDLVYLVEGQRLPLHEHEKADATTPQLRMFLTRLKPYGSFWGAVQRHLPVSGGWFYLGLYILIGLFFAALSAHRALHFGLNPALWFGLGLVFSVLGYIVLRTRPPQEIFAPAGVPSGLTKISSTYDPVHCPGCEAENHPSAARCGSCGKSLMPSITSEVARAGLAPREGR
jgi:hypothetical protein